MSNASLVLTKSDINNLREAETVVFRTDKNGRSTVELVKNPLTDSERRVTLGLEHGYSCYRGSFNEACHVITSCRFHAEWVTLVDFNLRAGDELRLHWVGGNNSLTLDEAGLFHDIIKVHVIRELRGKRRLMVYDIDSTICPANSARMVK